MKKEKAAVVILIDGADPSTLARLAHEGELPNISRLIKEGSFDVSTSTFPTTTGCAHLPFLTGKFAGECNIPGGRWKDDSGTRTYFKILGKNLNDDIDVNVKTLFDFFKSACVYSPIKKGSNLSIPPVGHPLCHLTNHWMFFDKIALSITERILRYEFDFVFTCLYSIDELSHRKGCSSPRVKNAYKVIDKKIGQLDNSLKQNYQDYLMFIVSDHGITDTYNHIDIVKIIKSLGFSVNSYPFNLSKESDIFVGECGNSMANIYLNNGKSDCNDISSHLTKVPGVDLVAYNNEGIHVLKKETEALLHQKDGAVKYEPLKGDPLKLEEYSNEWLSEDEAHKLTLETQYPDSVVQILQVFKSPRAGDVIVTAENGFDVRKFEIPQHRASHGSFNREHMLVPVITNKKLNQGTKRTNEVFGIIKDYLSS